MNVITRVLHAIANKSQPVDNGLTAVFANPSNVAMAAATLSPAPSQENPMSDTNQQAPAPTVHHTLLQTIGSDIKKAFAWLGSPSGKATVSAAEAVVESVYPPATGIINLGNTWLTEIIKSETLATAAGVQDGSGTQKSAMVLNVLTPEVLAFAASQKMPVPDASTIALANTKLVEFLNLFGAPGSAK